MHDLTVYLCSRAFETTLSMSPRGATVRWTRKLPRSSFWAAHICHHSSEALSTRNLSEARSFPWDGRGKQSLNVMPLNSSVNPSGFWPHFLSPSSQSRNTPMCRALASLPIPSLSSLEYCLWSGFRDIMGLEKLVQDKGLFVQICSLYSKSLQTFDFNIQNTAFWENPKSFSIQLLYILKYNI